MEKVEVVEEILDVVFNKFIKFKQQKLLEQKAVRLKGSYFRRRKIGRTEFSPYTTGTNSIYGNMAHYINLLQTAIGASNRTNSTGEHRLFGAGIVCDLPKKYDLQLCDLPKKYDLQLSTSF